jgi:hypothetical protein
LFKQLKGMDAGRRVATNLVNLPSKSYIMTEPLGVVLLSAHGTTLFNYCLRRWWALLQQVIV